MPGLFQQNHDSVSPLKIGFKAACPRCGRGKLYKSMLVPADRCNNCDLDFSFIDSGDGPAVIVVFVLGMALLPLALLVESIFAPPLWVHAAIWTPLIIVACIWLLRFAKAMMIALQYRSDARQNVEIKKD